MRKFILLLLLSLTLVSANAQSGIFSLFRANYFVSEDGDDNNSGKYPWAPWQTLTKVNSTSFAPGDVVAFKGGDSWTGTLVPAQSGIKNKPVTYTSYMWGDKPKIYGSQPITGWTKRGASDIYVTKYSTADVTQLFLNGKKMKVARYPNTGYHIITTETGDITITASAMTSQASNYYINAKVLTRQRPWYSDIRTVASSTGNTITLNAIASDIQTGEGFVLINKLEFLDAAGEWFYNTTTDSLYFWTPSGATPVGQVVTGSTIADGVQINGKNYITIKNLHILEQKSKGINTNSICGNIKIINNTIEGQEEFGIEAENTANGGTRLEYSGNIIRDISGGAIYAYRNDTSIIRDNVISRIGLFENIGIFGTSQVDAAYGMYINGRGNLIEYNTLDSIGYTGINWKSYADSVNHVYVTFYGSSIVRYNYIKNVGLFKSDGGGIYASGISAPGSLVSHNIIEGSYGYNAGSSDSRNFGEGIYLDEPSRSITLEYNTIILCTNSGINVHDGTSHDISHNTIFDCRQSIGVNDTVNSTISSFTYNLCITSDRLDNPAYEPRQLTTNYFNDFNMDLWDYNKYVNVYTSNLVFKVVTPFGYNDFAAWQTYTGGEANSTYVGTDLAVGETQRVFYNASKVTKTYSGGTARDENGTIITTFVLEPFKSKYLVGTNLNLFTESI